MSNVKNITADMVTPTDVLESLIKQLGGIKSIYAVVIDKDGQPQIWASGNLIDMAYASAAFNAKLHEYVLDKRK